MKEELAKEVADEVAGLIRKYKMEQSEEEIRVLLGDVAKMAAIYGARAGAPKGVVALVAFAVAASRYYHFIHLVHDPVDGKYAGQIAELMRHFWFEPKSGECYERLASALAASSREAAVEVAANCGVKMVVFETTEGRLIFVNDDYHALLP